MAFNKEVQHNSRCLLDIMLLRHHALYYTYNIPTFVCDTASEIGAMGSTLFLGFSCTNLLLVFLNLLFLGTCIIFFSQVLGLSLGLFYLF